MKDDILIYFPYSVRKLKTLDKKSKEYKKMLGKLFSVLWQRLEVFDDKSLKLKEKTKFYNFLFMTFLMVLVILFTSFYFMIDEMPDTPVMLDEEYVILIEWGVIFFCNIFVICSFRHNFKKFGFQLVEYVLDKTTLPDLKFSMNELKKIEDNLLGNNMNLLALKTVRDINEDLLEEYFEEIGYNIKI